MAARTLKQRHGICWPTIRLVETFCLSLRFDRSLFLVFSRSLGTFPLCVFRSVFQNLWSVGTRARIRSCHEIPIGHTQEGQAAGVAVLPLSVRMVALKPRRLQVSACTRFSASEFVDGSKSEFLVLVCFTHVDCYEASTFYSDDWICWPASKIFQVACLSCSVLSIYLADFRPR